MIAIIIPIYKAKFLKEALDSVFMQDISDCNIYLFNDGSPENIEEIIAPYLLNQKVTYYKFENNLGANDLAGHWNRCIKLTRNEEWIYLFSDDDVLEFDAFQSIKATMINNPLVEILTLNIKFINSNGDQILKNYSPPLLEAPEQFALSRLLNKRPICCGGFIFKRGIYSKVGGYVSLKNAWHSDEITYHKMLQASNGPSLLVATAIKFRLSGINISSNSKIEDDKLEALHQAKLYWFNYFTLQLPCYIRLLENWVLSCMASSGGIVRYDVFQEKWMKIQNKKATIYLYIKYIWMKFKIIFKNLAGRLNFKLG